MIQRIIHYFRRDKPNLAVEMQVQSRATLDIVDSIQKKRARLDREFPVATLIERKSNVRQPTN
jgi:hypothetical protein